MTVGPDATLQEAARLILDRNISCLPVVHGGRLVDILTLSDFGLTPRYRRLVDNLYSWMGYSWMGVPTSLRHMGEVARRVRS